MLRSLLVAAGLTLTLFAFVACTDDEIDQGSPTSTTRSWAAAKSNSHWGGPVNVRNALAPISRINAKSRRTAWRAGNGAGRSAPAPCPRRRR